MSPIRFTAILLCLLTLPARANLGESVKQLVSRYGTPVKFSEPIPNFPFGTIVFSASGITLVVFLVGDKEVGAKVYKTDKTAFSDSERDLIISTDGGSQWVSTPSTDPTTLQWTRPDKATVMYDKQKNMLIFTSDEMAQAVKTAEANPPSAAASATANAPATNKSMLQLPPPPMAPPDLNLPPGK
jgi:hypothetical protein